MSPRRRRFPLLAQPITPLRRPRREGARHVDSSDHVVLEAGSIRQMVPAPHVSARTRRPLATQTLPSPTATPPGLSRTAMRATTWLPLGSTRTSSPAPSSLTQTLPLPIPSWFAPPSAIVSRTVGVASGTPERRATPVLNRHTQTQDLSAGQGETADRRGTVCVTNRWYELQPREVPEAKAYCRSPAGPGQPTLRDAGTRWQAEPRANSSWLTAARASRFSQP